jgi:hypothetical protein
MKIKLSCSLNDWAIYYDWAVYSTMDSTTYSTADFLLGYSTEGYFKLNCGWGIVKGGWGDYNWSKCL